MVTNSSAQAPLHPPTKLRSRWRPNSPAVGGKSKTAQCRLVLLPRLGAGSNNKFPLGNLGCIEKLLIPRGRNFFTLSNLGVFNKKKKRT